MPSISRVRRAGRCDCSTRRMISSFSEPGSLMPLVDLPGFRKQLHNLQAGAEKRLVVERQKKAN